MYPKRIMTACKIILKNSGSCLSVPALLFLAFCISCTAPEQEYNLGDLEVTNGHHFVAYRSPNRYLKPDTVFATWKYTGPDAAKLEIAITFADDSTYVIVENTVSSRNDAIELRWVPGADTMHFNYFGDRECIFSVSDEKSEITLTSEPFTVTGPVPLKIDFPETAIDHPFEDTLFLQYRINSDRISQIRIFYENRLTPKWIEYIKDPSNKILNSPSPITGFEVPFIPSEADTQIVNHPEEPIRFLFKDYQSPFAGSALETDEITLFQ